MKANQFNKAVAISKMVIQIGCSGLVACSWSLKAKERSVLPIYCCIAYYAGCSFGLSSFLFNDRLLGKKGCATS